MTRTTTPSELTTTPESHLPESDVPASDVPASDVPASDVPASDVPGSVDDERTDLLAVLALQRHFLRFTTRDLTDEQVGRRTTASELCLGGLIKHVASAERNWVNFLLDGPSSMGDFEDMTEEDFARRADEFRMLPGETLEGVLADYAEVARRTEEVVTALPDLNVVLPLPKAPWFQESEWSARRVLIHIITETAQHSGHADIIRESLDGAKTMG